MRGGKESSLNRLCEDFEEKISGIAAENHQKKYLNQYLGRKPKQSESILVSWFRRSQ